MFCSLQNLFLRLANASFLLLLLLITDYWSLNSAHAQDAGKSGLAFLKVGVGSRGAALGEAYSALVNEPAALYWNPAGLAAVRGTHVTFTHVSWLQSINHEFAAVAFPGFGGTLGFGVIAQMNPGIEVRTDQPTAEPIGTFDAQDLAVMLAFGRQWRPNLAAGFSIKYLYEKIYLNSAAGFAADLGALWQTPVEHLQLSATVQNLGVMEALRKDEIKLPALVRLGGAYVFPFSAGENHLALAAEHVLFLEGGNGSSAGAEFLFRKALALRVGYQFNRENRSVTGGFGTTFGRYQLDYGYAPFTNDLGNAHRFSVEVKL